MNPGSCRRVRQSRPFGLLVCCALAALALPIRAHAQFLGKAAAIVQFESNSNVFYLNRGAAPPGTGDSRRSDTFVAYGAQFDATYSWRRQEFYATASTTQYDYQRFTELNHTGYSLDAGLNWKLTEPLDGKLDVTRTRNMVPFYNLSGGSAVTLSLVTEQKETAQAGLKLNSEWKLEGSAYTSKTDQPVVGAPNLRLNQTSTTMALDYLGVTGLTSGLTAGYLSGDYRGSRDTSDPSFSQTTVGFLAKYKRSRTTLDGQIGYSRRTSANGIDSTSGLTGSLDIAEQLTPKTTFTAKIARVINNYVFNSGSEIDSDVGAGVTWQATHKSAVALGYTFSYREFPGQGNNPVGSDRTDIAEYATLDINYQPWRWLLIRPYLNAQTRRSTFIGGHFSSTVFGVYVTATAPPGKRK
jgi:hypothetical protein